MPAFHQTGDKAEAVFRTSPPSVGHPGLASLLHLQRLLPSLSPSLSASFPHASAGTSWRKTVPAYRTCRARGIAWMAREAPLALGRAHNQRSDKPTKPAERPELVAAASSLSWAYIPCAPWQLHRGPWHQPTPSPSPSSTSAPIARPFSPCGCSSLPPADPNGHWPELQARLHAIWALNLMWRFARPNDKQDHAAARLAKRTSAMHPRRLSAAPARPRHRPSRRTAETR